MAPAVVAQKQGKTGAFYLYNVATAAARRDGHSPSHPGGLDTEALDLSKTSPHYVGKLTVNKLRTDLRLLTSGEKRQVASVFFDPHPTLIRPMPRRVRRRYRRCSRPPPDRPSLHRRARSWPTSRGAGRTASWSAWSRG